MKIRLYKALDKGEKIIKILPGEYNFPELEKNKELRILNDEDDFYCGEIEHYQFLGNMLYVKTVNEFKYFFDIICD